MDVKDILDIESIDGMLKILKDDTKTTPYTDIADYIKYYDGEHPIITERPDESVTEPDGKNSDGTPKEKTVAKIRTRKVLNYQIQIINTAESMLFGKEPTFVLNNDEEKFKDLFSEFQKVYKEGRFNFSVKELLQRVSIETKAVEFFFWDEGQEKIKSMIWASKFGDKVWAHFNSDRDLDAITREYDDEILEKGEKVKQKVIQIYTAESLTVIKDVSGTLIREKPVKNPYEMIQAVYIEQEYPEWYYVKELVSINERSESQQTDVNKRIGNPGIMLKGKVDRMPSYDSDVKVFKSEGKDDGTGKMNYGEVSLIESKGAPEGIENQLKRTDSEIYKFSWPDLSFLRDVIKTGQASGVAIKLMMTDAFIMKGIKEKTYLPAMERRNNIIKKMMSVNSTGDYTELDISITLNSIIPENELELIEGLTLATGGQTIMSQETAVSQNPKISDTSSEIEKIKTEESEITGGTDTV